MFIFASIALYSVWLIISCRQQSKHHKKAEC
jgi:hypothetical protein